MKLAMVAHLVVGTAAAGQWSFVELPYSGLDSAAGGINANGSVIVGGGGGSLRWVNGSIEILPPSGSAFGTDSSGSVVVGGGFDAGYRWSASTGVQRLPVPGCQGGIANAVSVSGDGQIVVGTIFCSNPQPQRIEGFRWTEATGVVPMGLAPTIVASEANAISGDGEVIVGHVWLAQGGTRAMRWNRQSGYELLDGTSVRGVSFDGRVLVGRSVNPVRWVNNQLQDLGQSPGTNRFGEAWDVTDDGYVVVGNAHTPETGAQPFIWDPVHGMRNLRQLLGVSSEEWPELTVAAISGDGSTIAGYGDHPIRRRPWMARVPHFCYANCDDSTMSPALNVNDFVCFLTHFADSDLFYADCNVDAALNVNDFVCFTQKFAAGCP